METPPATDGPLVVVGIPTHNRLAGLRRAVDSVLAQTHPRVLIIISDNASTDGTDAYARQLARCHRHVLYRRHQADVGAVANFNSILEGVAGDFFMFLADDDWLDADYLARCVRDLRQDAGYVLVAGRARFDGRGAMECHGLSVQLDGSSAAERVRLYHDEVADNSVFYGVMPVRVIAEIGGVPDVFGGDHLFVSAAAALGMVKTIDETSLHRSFGGMSGDAATTVTLALVASSAMQWISLAANVFKDIAWRSTAYSSVTPAARVVLAIRCQRRVVPRVLWTTVLRIGRMRTVRPASLLAKRLYVARLARGGRRLHFPGHATFASHDGRLRRSDEATDRPRTRRDA